jgi:hypothetical protein
MSSLEKEEGMDPEKINDWPFQKNSSAKSQRATRAATWTALRFFKATI